MNDTLQSAKDAFLQSKQGLLLALDKVPDDRLNWSPAPTARTPVALVVHAAEAIGAIHAALDGTRFPYTDTAEADRAFLQAEAKVHTREEAVRLFEERANAYLAWFDGLDASRLETSPELPFGGPAPMGFAITIPALHTQWHVAQIHYVQTAYGDRTWYF